MVILGNPPYSGHSANTGKWINDLLRGADSLNATATENYFMVDGEPLGERNPKWLNDDYVKFIRFAQWRIDRTGYGVLAFVTNHGYLDNPTFRGMRQSLMKSFDEIYVLDLHGNSKKKERSPDGSKDENVFDIQQGVSIGIFVKKQCGNTHEVSVSSIARENALTSCGLLQKGENTCEKCGNTHVSKCVIKHKHLYGVREIWTENVNDEKELSGGKYQWLANNDVSTTEWKEIEPNKPFYLFTPQNTTLLPEYNKGWNVTDIFLNNAVGFQTHRDYLVISPSKSELLERMKIFTDKTKSDEEIRKIFFSHIAIGTYPLGDTRDWKLHKSREDLFKISDLTNWITKCIRRPFDFQWYFYHPSAIDYGRPAIMNQLIEHNQENIALLWTRPMSPNYEFSVLCSSVAVDQSVVGNKVAGAGGTYVAPLYIYPTEKRGLFDEETSTRQPNFSGEFISEFSAKLKLEFKCRSPHEVRAQNKNTLTNVRVSAFTPEDVFNYAYAVFHSPTYRARYAEFLKIDFPRLPLTSNYQLFFLLARLGERLVELHLLEKDIESDVTFPEKGSNEVEFVKFTGGNPHVSNLWC